MEVKIEIIPEQEKEVAILKCHQINRSIKDIEAFIRTSGGKLAGSLDGNEYQLPVSDIYYVESVDNHCFLYCRDKVYQNNARLYELEDKLKGHHFLRVSKSVVLNLMKVESIRPSLNSRFLALLKNGEEILITRKYVPDLKRTLKGGGQ